MTGHRRSYLSRNVLGLGVVSLLTDVGSELVIPLLPAFLGTLGASALALGFIEGIADAVASLLKLVSGRWADLVGRNRPFVIVGYALSALARPLVAFTGSAFEVLVVRAVDRTGKGLRTSPRDAIIAATVRPEEHGAAFGLHRAFDHAGAVLGPLAAVCVLTYFTQDLRVLFLLSAIPGAFAVLVLLAVVREAPAAELGVRASGATKPAPARGAFARFLVPLGLFTLGNASDAFLLLKASEARAPLVELPLLWMGLHIVKVVASGVGGQLADRLGRRKVIVLGWLVYAAIYVAFAFAESRTAVALLFLAYGIYHGLTEGPEKALVAELAPARQRGSAFGWYHLTLGLLGLSGSVLFGGLWEALGSRVAFLTSASLAGLASLLFVALARDARTAELPRG